MTHKILDKKIPTILGMMIIIAGLSITTLLVNKQTVLQIGAQTTTQPQEVRITNLTDNSFTVSYITINPTSGHVSYGLSNNSLDQTAFDENDQSQKLQGHIVHSVTLTNLSPETKYYFSINSGGDIYLNNGKSFEAVTTQKIANSNLNNFIIGNVVLPSSNPPKEAILYITIDNSQVLSTLIDASGTYKINLNHLLNLNLSDYSELSKNSIINILILGDSLTSNVRASYLQNIKIPTVTLSNNYDFRFKTEISSSSSATLSSFPSFKSTTSLTKTKDLQILTPKENQVVDSQTPDLKGTSLPNQNIQIIIHSQQQITTSVSSDSSGNWNYQPSTALEPGVHTITVSAKDSSGIVKTLTQSFTVYAQELSPTPTPTTIPLDSAIKESTISATSTPQPLPVVGNASIIAAGIAGLLISITGGLIFLLSHKGI